MVELTIVMSPPFMIILISFLFTSQFLVLAASTSTNNIKAMSTCLIHNNVHNFSVYPTGGADSSNSNYFNLLYFSIQNLRFAGPAVPKPSLIIVPGSKEEVASSVLCCRQCSYEIRVRCGGHSYEGTSYVSVDGSPFALIDMLRLNNVSIDMDSETAWVQGGATIGETYYAIAQASDVHGFSAGTDPTVGISGHVMGGGFGVISRKYGLAADNVVDAILIDAQGRLLDRKAMGEDVFWAIRGGGGGVWGIIYAWKIRLVRVPKTVTAFTISKRGSKENVAQFIHKWQQVGPKLEDGFQISISMGLAPPNEIDAQFNGFYLGPRSKVISIMDEAFPELGVLKDDCKEMSWTQSILFYAGLDNLNSSEISRLKDRYSVGRYYFKGKTDYVRSPIPMSGIVTTLDVLGKELRGYLSFDPYGGVMSRISKEAIAFPHRSGNLYAIHYEVGWNEEENAKSNAYIEWIRGFYNTMTPFVSSSPRASYINYLDLDLGVMEEDSLSLNNNTTVDNAVERARVWGEKYFLSNYDRLVKAKTIIDPLNVFRNQQGIPPMSQRTARA